MLLGKSCPSATEQGLVPVLRRGEELAKRQLALSAVNRKDRHWVAFFAATAIS